MGTRPERLIKVWIDYKGPALEANSRPGEREDESAKRKSLVVGDKMCYDSFTSIGLHQACQGHGYPDLYLSPSLDFALNGKRE